MAMREKGFMRALGARDSSELHGIVFFGGSTGKLRHSGYFRLSRHIRLYRRGLYGILGQCGMMGLSLDPSS